MRLFERDKRQVRPTRAGAALVEDARAILRQTDRLCEQARSFGAPLSGPLRLGTIPTVGPYLLPKVLPAVRKTHPELQLYLREDLTPHLLGLLDSGELDLLLLATDVDLGDLATRALFSDPFLAAAHEDDELARQTETRIADVARRELLLLEEGHCLRDQTLALCEPKPTSLAAPGFRASSLGTVTQMVAGGLGVTLLPELAVEREVTTTPGLRVIPFGADGPYRTIGLAWRKSSARIEEFEMLGDTISKAYAEG